jgi:hypothetical protein
MTKWPRYCELFCALWLIVSGWVVEYPDPAQYRLISITAGVLIAVFDVLAITLRKRYAHLLVLPLAAALIVFSFLAAPWESQGAQNLITTGLLLMMFAILPTEATLPPPSWREFERGTTEPRP